MMYAPTRIRAIALTSDCEFGRRVALATLTHDVREDASIEDLLLDIRQMLVAEEIPVPYQRSISNSWPGHPGDTAWMESFLDWAMQGCHDAALHGADVREGLRCAMEFHLTVRDWCTYQNAYGNLVDAENRMDRIKDRAGEQLLIAAQREDLDPVVKSYEEMRVLLAGYASLHETVNGWMNGTK